MLGIILGIVNVTLMGITNAMSRVPSKLIGQKKLMFFRQIVTIIGLGIILLFTLKSTTFDIKYIIFALLISIIVYFAMLLMYKAFEIGNLGIVSPIASSSVIYSVILTTFFFHFPMKSIQVISMAVIVVGILLISTNFKEIKGSKSNKGVIPAILTSLLFGVFFFFAQISNRVLGPYLNAFLFEVGMFICVVIDLYLTKEKLIKVDKGTIDFIILLGILSVISITAYYCGFKVAANPAIFLVISAPSPLVATIYSSIVYKEKLTLQQYFAGFLILAGICTISL